MSIQFFFSVVDIFCWHSSHFLLWKYFLKILAINFKASVKFEVLSNLIAIFIFSLPVSYLFIFVSKFLNLSNWLCVIATLDFVILLRRVFNSALAHACLNLTQSLFLLYQQWWHCSFNACGPLLNASHVSLIFFISSLRVLKVSVRYFSNNNNKWGLFWLFLLCLTHFCSPPTQSRFCMQLWALPMNFWVWLLGGTARTFSYLCTKWCIITAMWEIYWDVFL